MEKDKEYQGGLPESAHEDLSRVSSSHMDRGLHPCELPEQDYLHRHCYRFVYKKGRGALGTDYPCHPTCACIASLGFAQQSKTRYLPLRQWQRIQCRSIHRCFGDDRNIDFTIRTRVSLGEWIPGVVSLTIQGRFGRSEPIQIFGRTGVCYLPHHLRIQPYENPFRIKNAS